MNYVSPVTLEISYFFNYSIKPYFNTSYYVHMRVEYRKNIQIRRMVNCTTVGENPKQHVTFE